MREVLARVAEQVERGEVGVPGLGRFSIYEGRSERLVRLRFEVRSDRFLDGSFPLEGVAAELVAALRVGPVAIVGLGVFSISSTEARSGRNPATGEVISIPSREILRFVGERR